MLPSVEPMCAPPQDIAWAVAQRHMLHQHPNLSDAEGPTADTLLTLLRGEIEALPPQDAAAVDVSFLTELAGTAGFAAVITLAGGDASAPATPTHPVTTLRCELDALPLSEAAEWRPHASKVPGVAHKCGHDGHMAILALVFRRILRAHATFLQRGRIVLLFQPAEETGTGAAAVVTDPRLRTAMSAGSGLALALHNASDMPAGVAHVRAGTLACASRGVRLHLQGAHAHVAYPETGVSPLKVLVALVNELEGMQARSEARRIARRTSSSSSDGEPPAKRAAEAPFPAVAITYARLGTEPNYGIAPGEAELLGDIRTETDEEMEVLKQELESCVTKAQQDGEIKISLEYHDVFSATVNSAEGSTLIEKAAVNAHVPCAALPEPMRWAEDFGEVIKAAGSGAMFILGGGDRPALHTHGYDFNDATLDNGARVFLHALAIRHH